ncbi:hemopexin repeat-containing protein [Micromonospora sp. NBC_01796]|uniref:hemopexin repeat-containing protein n=1 Tax=Micromonospora sp. NBC_01796 TaxID=2975987 RepID=UPI002DDC8F7A|nr:hemopexin repeat-containing protein [Micromonospora sp. NBC_01796]WSA85134.1 hemopexin repeat-containing protein [Micromonospora sp. NBC_01796]
MSRDGSLPNYELLFGELDLRPADESRAVYSPAAYLADLLRLLEENVEGASLLARRPDIKDILLDAENTLTEKPYLDIVNEILESLVGAEPYERLRTMRFPFDKPFSLADERLRRYLTRLGVAPAELYRRFAVPADPDIVAREYLGLTPEEVEVMTVARPTEADVRAFYGLTEQESLGDLETLDRFRRATGLSSAEVRELLFGHLAPGRAEASVFFVHHGGTPVGLDADETRLVGDGAVPVEWFERVSRFVRLARRTGLTPTELDLVLRGCCGNRLDGDALRVLAVVLRLRDQLSLPVEVVCSLAAPMDTIGIGPDGNSPDLFGRTFDTGPEGIERSLIWPWPGAAPAGRTELICTGDLLAPANREYRRRLAGALAMAEADLVATVDALREHYALTPQEPSPFDRGEIGLGALSLLHRVSRLTTALGISVDELFELLSVLDRDPSLWRHTTFPILLDSGPTVRDSHRILDAPDPASSLWLAQTLTAVVGWLRDSGLTTADLADFLPGGSTGAQDSERRSVLAALRARLDEVALTPELFVSARFGDRAARVVHEVLTSYEGVVSDRDARLLRLDAEAVEVAAYDAVTEFGAVTAEDFLGLGLDERLATKIFTNLVLAGYLRADGTLTETALAGDPPPLARDFEPQREPLFALIRDLGLAGSDPSDGDDGAAFLYPSDLQQLPDLDQTARDELYDNLVHHGYLEPGGEIVNRDLFADEEGFTDFAVNADLDDVAPAVLDALRERVDRFRTVAVDLGPDTFVGLPLDEGRVADLLASLRFNGYLDELGHYRDKQALAGLRRDELDLSLDFYAYREDILAAMQAQIAAVRAELCTFTVDDFRPLADTAIAARVVHALDGVFLDQAMIRPEIKPLLGTPEQLPPVPGPFPAAEQTMIADRLVAIQRDERPYVLDPEALTGLGLDADERDGLIRLLVQAGDLEPWLTLPRGRIAWFGTASNALDFALTGLEDYGKDVFHLLHGVALELAAGIGEITATLDGHAQSQSADLLAVLRDAFGVPVETVDGIARAVAGDSVDALETLLGQPAEQNPTGTVADDPRARLTYRRIRGFARLAAKLDLDPTEVEVVFRDQDLAGKFPEPVALPTGVDRFDALLQSADGTIYLFVDTGYYRYAASTRALLDDLPAALTELSPALGALRRVDAALTRPDGTEWIIGRDTAGAARAFVRQPGSTRWVATEQTWGTVRNTFAAPERIDAAYVDADGRTYLFSGDQYVRYSGADHSVVDEGFPRPVTEWWAGEADLPAPFTSAIDAAFHDRDGRVHLFSGDRTLTIGTSGGNQIEARPIAEVWGRTPPPFADRVDAAYTDGAATYLLAGDLVVRHHDGLENNGLRTDDGYPRRIASHFPGVPAGFESGLDAAFVDAAGVTNLFKGDRTVALGRDPQPVPTAQRWGVLGPVLVGGTVDAAFTGLDGHTYVFSGGRYLRYSGADYAMADLGYPRGIAGDWGGLREVGTSFVLDGRTYLFGVAGDLFDVPADWRSGLGSGRLSPLLRRRFADHGVSFTADARVEAAGTPLVWRLTDERGARFTVRSRPDRLTVASDDNTPYYVRYSTRDYATPDAGYPRPLSDGWWNLPVALGAGLADVDAVLTGRDGLTYLFVGDRFVVFDARRRWWSEPRTLREHWDSLPFDRVDAAFLGRDGRTYVFSGDRYVRYSTADYTRIDDRYPAMVATAWGRVPNNLARTGRVDATLVMDVVETVDGVEVTRTHTYLFSGEQYLRYEGSTYATVQDGYPRPLSALAGEPRLGKLPVALTRVDAAFADRGNVYLFEGSRCHVVSDVLYRQYAGPTGVGCAFVEDGALLVGEGDHWHRLGAIEAKVPTAVPVRPRVLRGVPETFATGLDAVLAAPGGATYLFKGTGCYDVRLRRDYPIAETWGLPRDNITRDGVVDAVLVGRDGRTYVFSGDQFVTYAGEGYPTREPDGGPRPVADHWGGLSAVALAYVYNGTTYLFEPADHTGRMRYLTYSGADYTTPDGEPGTADAGFWAAGPGFGPPAAVIVEGDTMLLLRGERYVQRTGPTGAWSAPQPIGLLWRGYGRDPEPDETLRTVFVGRDGTTHFFFGERYTRYTDRSFTTPVEVRTAWGLPAFERVDAAVVDPVGGATFLFSGDRYARYTGTDYRDADPGYPRPIAGNLRTEEAFRNLPESFEDTPAVRGVDAVVANGRHVYLFAGGGCQVVSRSAYATYDLATLGRVRNTVVDTGKVDAAMVVGTRTYLFSGDQYVRYSGTDHTFVDEGYPRTIESSLAGEFSQAGTPELAELPVQFRDGVDAAFRDADGGVHLFRGANYLRADAATPVVRPAAELWGRVRNEFETPGAPVDAAFVAPDGALYAFRGGQFVRYSGTDLRYVDPGHPRTIRDDWGDLPAAFEAGIDGAFSLDDATYLLRGDEYVRYSTGWYETVDRTFPQEIRHRFSEAADYRLSDVHTIARFARLAHGSGDGSLAGVLAAGPAVEDPYQRLAELLGWDVDEIRWVKRHGGFLPTAPGEEDRFELEFVLKLGELFALARRLGTGPSRLHSDIWSQIHGPAGAVGGPERAAALDRAVVALHGLLAETLPATDLAVLTDRLHDELAAVRRDALASAVLAPVAAPTPGTLFERLLVDVDMGAPGTTSRVREAIAAAQLYLHRYLLDLEPVGAPTRRDEDEARLRIKRWWAWMKNYRTWEANRKVFLYPENYLRPELRDTKTPAFLQLESDLLQAGVTTGAAQAAYKRYLDEYTEVSRLAIAGGYVYAAREAAEGSRSLVLFGRTRTSPRRYYYRGATFRDGDRLSATWGPWLKVDVQIDAEKVYPVHAFDRVFVFWTTIETVTPEGTGSTTIIAKKTGDTQQVSAPDVQQSVKIYFSFRNLNQEWVPAQVLATGAPRPDGLGNVALSVRSGPLPGQSGSGDHQAIVVTYTATTGAGEITGAAFALTPELYTVPVEGIPSEPPRTGDLGLILDEPGGIDPFGVVWFSSPASFTEGAWFSVDHKGGSFLCRPVVPAPADPPTPAPIRGSAEILPAWDRIDAAVELPDGSRYFFDNTAQRYVLIRPGRSRSGPSSPISGRWGRTGRSITRSGVVDAGLTRGEQVFVFSGNQYLRYSSGLTAPADAGYPKDLQTNTERLPRWNKVDYAYTGTNGVEYFFSADLKGWVSSTDLNTLRPVDRGWEAGALPEADRISLLNRFAGGLLGRLGASFLEAAVKAGHKPGKGTLEPPPQVDLLARWWSVDAGYVDGGRLHLTNGTEYVRYTLGADGTIPDLVDDGYPRTLARPLDAVFQQGDRRYALSGDVYAAVPAGGELGSLGAFTRIAGHWGDLPTGITGALDAATDLFLFLDTTYVTYPRSATVPRPYEFASLQHEIVRLTTSTAYKLNQRLLAGGVAGLLDTATQETDELPAFRTDLSDATTVRVRPGRVNPAWLPGSAHLDFQSANGIYYWEIFFHAPLLIAQALNGAQRFEDARVWYEYVFDPTRPDRYWRFLPFLAVDPAALADDITGAVAELERIGADTEALERRLGPTLETLRSVAPVFHGVRELTTADRRALAEVAAVTVTPPPGLPSPDDLIPLNEALAVAKELQRQYDLMGDRGRMLDAYRDDPFDPHAIAELRPIAYRRATVMGYIDNLLDWADLLFRQYTPESIDEARMLYILAHDLLGVRPDVAGPRPLTDARSYGTLDGHWSPEGPLAALTAGGAMLDGAGAVHASVADTYFHVPGNTALGDYWDLVADRLRKIRMSLDIMGISRPVPLFAPPIDPADLVRSVASGVGVEAALQGTAVPVPHQRFAVVFRRAQELADRLRQFGQDLLGALDRRDAEQLNLLQTRQEGEILALTRGARQAQVGAAEAGLRSARAARDSALARIAHYEKVLDDGLSALQIAQLTAMAAASTAHLVASGLKIYASVAHATPQVLVGPFILGTEYGGKQVGDSLENAAEIAESLGEGLSVVGELLGVRSDQEQAQQDWQFQLDMARNDLAQLEPEVAAAEYQLVMIQRELEILGRQTAHQEEVAAFLRDKFTGAELFQWTATRLGALYFQAYGLAEETARSAERAFQFERGVPESAVAYVKAAYWESRRNGLLAGESLTLDLDRLGKAYADSHSRGMEITKRVSLRDLDAVALLRLRTEGVCEFALTEELFDRDFPGHYRRQIRTVAVTFTDAEGAVTRLNAVLTQTGHKTVLEPDPRAVKHLLDPQGTPPASLRFDWRADQQIALSDVPEGYDNNGLFELRYDDDRYLPFEGTGAVSTWRLALTGGRPPQEPGDVELTLRYTADNGGEVFTSAVRGLLKPYPASRYLDVAAEFPQEWERFLGGEDRWVILPLTPDWFPGMSGRQVTGIYAAYAYEEGGSARFLLNDNRNLPLADGRLLPTPGLTLPADGSGLSLALDGDPAELANLVLIVNYRATA